METKTYKSTIENSLKRFTIILSAVLFSMPIIRCCVVQELETSTIIVTSILLFLWGAIYSLMPKKVVITKEKIVVKRLFKEFVIPVSNIVAVTLNEKQDFMNDSRGFAVVGLFGYYGYFRSTKYGNYYSISNNNQNNILLMTTKGSFQISCDSAPEAILTISSLLK